MGATVSKAYKRLMREPELPSDSVVDIGVAAEISRPKKRLTFIRIRNLPTGKERSQVGLGQERMREVQMRLLRELMKEIDADKT